MTQNWVAPNGAIEIKPGQWGLAIMPYSEVNMHMGVAGKPMLFYLRTDGMMVQLFVPEGRVFSGPITYGEAGIYRDHQGRYYYYPCPNPGELPDPVSKTYATEGDLMMLGHYMFEQVKTGELDERD